MPAATSYRTRAADNGKLGAELIAWRQALAAHWQEASFGAVRVVVHGTEQRVSVAVGLGHLDPQTVRVELYADALTGGEPERHAMKRARRLDEPEQGYEYSVTIPATRPPGDYTARLLPHHPIAAIPLEAREILWQR